MARTKRSEKSQSESRKPRRRNDTTKTKEYDPPIEIGVNTVEKFTVKVNKLTLSAGQIEYVKAIREKPIVLVQGLAGTGKTTIPMMEALKALSAGEIKHIIYTKPIVTVGASLGFLPKGVDEKIAPFVEFTDDVLKKIISPEKIIEINQRKIIQHEPLQFVRGKTFDDAFIIFDEAQNATKEEHHALITRLGINSKLIIICDKNQIDLPTYKGVGTGVYQLFEFIKLWEQESISESVKYVELTEEDCHRSPLLKEYYKIKSLIDKS